MLEGELSIFSNFNKSNTFEIENFTFGFAADLEFVPNNFPTPIVQLNFDANISWVLHENPDD
jgi:hypothetical protein